MNQHSEGRGRQAGGWAGESYLAMSAFHPLHTVTAWPYHRSMLQRCGASLAKPMRVSSTSRVGPR